MATSVRAASISAALHTLRLAARARGRASLPRPSSGSGKLSIPGRENRNPGDEPFFWVARLPVRSPVDWGRRVPCSTVPGFDPDGAGTPEDWVGVVTDPLSVRV